MSKSDYATFRWTTTFLILDFGSGEEPSLWIWWQPLTCAPEVSRVPPSRVTVTWSPDGLFGCLRVFTAASRGGSDRALLSDFRVFNGLRHFGTEWPSPNQPPFSSEPAVVCSSIIQFRVLETPERHRKSSSMADNRENERMNGESVGAAGGEGTWATNTKTYGHKLKQHSLFITGPLGRPNTTLGLFYVQEHRLFPLHI